MITYVHEDKKITKKHISEMKNHVDAAESCAAMGASLAKIDNKEQNFFLSEMFHGDRVFWIGAEWNEDEDEFVCKFSALFSNFLYFTFFRNFVKSNFFKYCIIHET